MPTRSPMGAAVLCALGALTAAAPSARAQQPAAGPHDHDHDHQHLPPALRADLFEGWLDPWPHSDYSRLGSPFVHLFLSEPAYIDRGLHLDFGYTSGDDAREFEAEAELELGLTRRIGLVLEAPYLFLDPDDAPGENGPGDVAVAPRFLLLDYDRFLLSANLALELPTGDSGRGLGAGEAVLAPSLSAWIDLGCSFTAQANLGLEHALESDADTLAWGAALAYTFYLGPQQGITAGDGAVRSHAPVGTVSLIAEVRGGHPLDGPDKDAGSALGVLGASVTVAPMLEVRAGVTFPAWEPRAFDAGLIVGLIYHF